MLVPITSHKQKNTWVMRIFIYPHGTWKDYIRSVIWDWRQRSAGYSSKGRDPLVTQADLLAPRVCSWVIAQLHKKSPYHRRKISANSLWLYSYYTQLLPLENKNINYIFIYLRVLHCLSSDFIYVTLWIMRPYTNPWWQIQWVALRKYQANKVS